MEKIKPSLIFIEGGAKKSQKISELIFWDKAGKKLAEACASINGAAESANERNMIDEKVIGGFLQYYADMKLANPSLLQKPACQFSKQIRQQIASHFCSIKELKELAPEQFFDFVVDAANLKIACPELSREGSIIGEMVDDNKDNMRALFNELLERERWTAAAEIGGDIAVIDQSFGEETRSNSRIYEKLTIGLDEKPNKANYYPDYLRYIAGLKILFPDLFKRDHLFTPENRANALEAMNEFIEGGYEEIIIALNMKSRLKIIEADKIELGRTFSAKRNSGLKLVT